MRCRRVITLVVAAFSVTGCASHPPSVAVPAQVVVEPIPGTGVHMVRLAQTAFDALGVRAEPARAGSGGVVIPRTAVIYDPTGRSWAFVVVGPRSFVRHPIVIDHVDDTEAFLRSGPAAGTPVVTCGAPELLGSEYGVGEE